jgi:hypothetical protein
MGNPGDTERISASGGSGVGSVIKLQWRTGKLDPLAGARSRRHRFIDVFADHEDARKRLADSLAIGPVNARRWSCCTSGCIMLTLRGMLV